MIRDTNSKAMDRLKNDYNVYGYPTLFFDGSYSVITRGKNEESIYIKAIQRAEARDTHILHMNINVAYDNKIDELNSEVIIKNMENESYSGRLKVYLTEINS